MTSCKLLPIDLQGWSIALLTGASCSCFWSADPFVFIYVHFKKTFLFHASRLLFPFYTATLSASSAFVTFCPAQSGCTFFSRRSHLICHRGRHKMTVTFWYLEKSPPPLVFGVISFLIPRFSNNEKPHCFFHHSNSFMNW